MNFLQDPMQNTQTNQNPKAKVQNTFSTHQSKHDADPDTDCNFKTERQKYIQERLNRRKQVTKIRKQQFGSSSSQSEDQTQKITPKPTLIKDHQRVAQKQPINDLNKTQPHKQKKQVQQDFHLKHQAYIKQKILRKKQMVQQRKKQFGSSSSQSDQQQVNIKIPKTEQIKISQPVRKASSQKQEKSSESEQQSMMCKSQQIHHMASPTKKSLGSISADKQKQPILIQQIVYTKGQNINDSKKITVLIQSKKNLQWIQQTLVMQNKRIKFINQNLEFLIAHISKIKLFFTSVYKQYFKVKVTHKNEDYFFAVSTTKIIDQVPQYFYVFSRIVQDKLTLIGFEAKKNQSSIFPNYMNIKDAPQNLKNSSIVFGNILKKSQVLGNWQTRFIFITQKQIGSSKKPHDKPSMVIPCDTISQLWTRFAIQSNNMLNIKIMYGSNTKTQFGIPFSNYTDQYNWLYCFYRIISLKK